MEILEMHPVTTFSGLFLAAMLIGSTCLLIGVAAYCTEEWKVSFSCAIIVIISIFILVFQNPNPETGKISYTVEITDTSKYQELIEKGYEFSRVYENRNIYIIKGDELE